jgi:putative Mn2+ efflux pump MntP
MLWEARAAASDDPPGEPEADPFGTKVMLVLAVATSLDALAVGVTFPMLDVPLVSSLATIGLTTAVLSALALFAGHRFGAVLGKRLDALGGVC